MSEGQEVRAGETRAVVDAMKMQNALRAERDGTVKEILPPSARRWRSMNSFWNLCKRDLTSLPKKEGAVTG